MQNASADTGASRNSSALPGLAGLIREGEKLVNCCPFLPPWRVCGAQMIVRKTFSALHFGVNSR